MAAHEVSTLISRSSEEGCTTLDRANLTRLISNALDGPKGSSRDVATLVWGCGKLGIDLRGELAPLVGSMTQLSPKDVAMVLWGWAKMASSLDKGESLVEAPISRMVDDYLPKAHHAFTGVELANVIWALARLRHFTPVFTTLLAQATHLSTSISPTAISSIVWAAGVRLNAIGEGPPLEVIKGLYHSTLSSLYLMDPPCIASSIWGLGALGMIQETLLPHQVVVVVENNAHAFDMDNLKSILQFTWMDPSITACLGPEFLQRLAASPQPVPWTHSLPQVCLYLSRGSLQSTLETAHALHSYLGSRLNAITPSAVDAARLVAAFSNLSYLPSHTILTKLMDIALEGASSFYPNTYCMYAIALAQLHQTGHRLPPCNESLTIDQACSILWTGVVLNIDGVESIMERVLACIAKEGDLPSLPFARQAIAGLWARGMVTEAQQLIGAYPAGTLTENPASSSLHTNISQTLRSMGYGNVRDEVEICGIYRADVVIDDLGIVIECDGDVHYLYSPDSGCSDILIGSSVIRDKVFINAGWKVIRVSVAAWKNCKDAAGKVAMLRRLINNHS